MCIRDSAFVTTPSLPGFLEVFRLCESAKYKWFQPCLCFALQKKSAFFIFYTKLVLSLWAGHITRTPKPKLRLYRFKFLAIRKLTAEFKFLWTQLLVVLCACTFKPVFRTTVENYKMSYTNPSRFKSTQHQISPTNTNSQSRKKVMRINKNDQLKDKMVVFLTNFLN